MLADRGEREQLSAQIQRHWLGLRAQTPNPHSIINPAVLQLADLSTLRDWVAAAGL